MLPTRRAFDDLSAVLSAAMEMDGEHLASSFAIGAPPVTSVPVPTVDFRQPATPFPSPTNEYRQHRRLLKVLVQPGAPTAPSPIPIPIPQIQGSRVLIWKQDPTVNEIGVRQSYISSAVFSGPRDARITIQQSPAAPMPPVNPNAFGDFIQAQGTDAFDAVHTFAVVRQTLTMVERARGGTAVPWQWNGPANTDPLRVFPHGSDMQNAFYRRSQKELQFGFFRRSGAPPVPPTPASPHWIYTCRSLDIVAHETGHAILDGLKPGWLALGNPPQTGGLHESFGDLVAIFLALSQFDQVEAVIAQTKANLHNKVFLADLAEQFGLALGRPNGLRNADNNLKLSEVGNEVHAISQVFTGAIYDILADMFVFERKPKTQDDALVLHQVSQYLLSLVLRAMIQAPNQGATYADVVNRMMAIAAGDGKPVQYRNSIRNQFTLREVVVSPVALTEDVGDEAKLAPAVTDAPGAVQDRRACCGTMQLLENQLQDGEGDGHVVLFMEQIEEFRQSLAGEAKTDGKRKQ